MAGVIIDSDIVLRDRLFGVGEAAQPFYTSEQIVGHLSGVEVLIEGTRTEEQNGQPARTSVVISASLSPETLGGFGAMVGIADELEELFPNGTPLQIHSRDWGPAINVRIGDIDNDLCMVEGLAHGINGRENDGLWMVSIHPKEVPEDHPSITALLQARVLVAAAEYTLTLAQNAEY